MKIQTNNPRVLAVQTLARVKDGAYSNLQLNQVIKNMTCPMLIGAY